ncbi:Ser/Thr protein phosphatase [Magnaporthiopsis poae ATCC 64411]|uniref:Ser/Thr protein phosphatase n=1 Tax=Magnaporthiopsis poae (strain ATCC 64411 / 73-15) TaxID=644358 RepID=A0A0C4DRB7_MAGP6|nr:Ser/Thr protein phosphatase [Magnaporthiopsis poae ATCC 64411]
MQAAMGAGIRRRRPVMLICILASFLAFYLYYSRSADRDAARVAWRPAHSPDDQPPQKEAEGAERPPDANNDVPAQKPLAPMSYGTAARPPFKDLKNIVADLPSNLVPQPGTADGAGSGRPKRLVIVGDVHGMKAPLERLLEKVGFKREGGDHLIIVGDLINKGPDSAGVVELAMSLGASAVRGNNEDRVLLAHQAMKTRLVPGTGGDDGPAAFGISPDSVLLGAGSPAAAKASAKKPPSASQSSPASSRDAEADMLEQNPFSHGDQGDRGTVASLTPAQLAWLADLPVILRVGTIRESPFTNLIVVHAGMVPGIAPEKQDPWAVMNMRTLKYPGREALKERVKEELEEAEKKRVAVSSNLLSSSAVSAQQVEAELASRHRKGKERDGHDDVAVPVEGRDGEQWTDAWARYQRDRVARDEDRVTVVYGHDALRGLSLPATDRTDRLTPGSTFGLDSGCVYGRQLTALVIEATAKGNIQHEIVHVKCEEGRAGKGRKGRK